MTEADLTRQQTVILQRIADGETPKTVARELGVTTGTVHNHLHRAYPRLGVNTLVHAVLEAARRNHIDLRA